jgi:ACT domain-containing protein
MKRAITERDIESLARDGKLVVTRDMVLTPAAREAISRKGLSVTYAEDAPPPVAPAAQDEISRVIQQVLAEELARAAAPAAAAPPPPAPPPPPERIPEAAARDTRVGSVGTECLQRVLDCAPGQPSGERAVVTVVGENRPGIVSRISAAVAECGGDLADISQVILDRYFSMIFIVNLEGLSRTNTSFRVFKERLQDEAVRIGQVQVLVMHEGIFKAMHEV